MTTSVYPGRTEKSPLVQDRLGRPARGRTGSGIRVRRIVPYLMVAPFCVLFFCFFVVPMGYALYTSLFKTTLFSGTEFAGLLNYRLTIGSSAFWDGVARIALFGCIQVPVMLGLALFFALVLDSGVVRHGKFFQLIYFIPYAVPTVVSALMWGFMYEPSFGPLGAVTRALGLGTPDFLGSHMVLASIGNVTTWEYTGYNMVILYTALQWVPRELEDAAIVDGASLRQFTWYVKLRSILPAFALTIILSVIGTMQIFTEPSIFAHLTSSITTSYTPNFYVYNLAFQQFDSNEAAAAAFVLAAVTIVLTAALVIASRRRRGER